MSKVKFAVFIDDHETRVMRFDNLDIIEVDEKDVDALYDMEAEGATLAQIQDRLTGEHEDESQDFIVRVWVPLDVRVESVSDAKMAESVASDYLNLQDPLTGDQTAIGFIREAVEPTVFYLKAAEIRFEAHTADD